MHLTKEDAIEMVEQKGNVIIGRRKSPLEKRLDFINTKLNQGCRVWVFDNVTKAHIDTYTKATFNELIKDAKIINGNLEFYQDNRTFILALNRKNAYRKFIMLCRK